MYLENVSIDDKKAWSKKTATEGLEKTTFICFVPFTELLSTKMVQGNIYLI